MLVCEVHAPGAGRPGASPTATPTPGRRAISATFRSREIYGELTEALGLQPTRDEHLVEALARAGRAHPTRLALIGLQRRGGVVAPSFGDEVRRAAASPEAAAKDLAASVQRRLGECLAALLRRLAAPIRAAALCLSGGLFFNTYFTTVAATCGAFERVHVPPHPGRNGTAVGAALLGAPGAAACRRSHRRISARLRAIRRSRRRSRTASCRSICSATIG